MPSSIVIGASRGIGRQVALTLATNGFKVGVAAKSTKESDRLPGTIYSVTEEIRQHGGHALALPCNVREEEQIEKSIHTCIEEFGHLDCLVYNAGAITWQKVAETPLKRFDMMTEVNIRGAYCAVQCVLPHFIARGSGRILLVAPPIYSRFFKGKTPYAITKLGMTVLTHGLGTELTGTGVSISALWPATVIESQVTKVLGVPRSQMRDPAIFADACLRIVQEPTDRYNGKALLDEDVLRDAGVTDFRQYRCDPEQEPPRMMPRSFPSLRVAEEDDEAGPSSKL